MKVSQVTIDKKRHDASYDLAERLIDFFAAEDADTDVAMQAMCEVMVLLLELKEDQVH